MVPSCLTELFGGLQKLTHVTQYLEPGNCTINVSHYRHYYSKLELCNTNLDKFHICGRHIFLSYFLNFKVNARVSIAKVSGEGHAYLSHCWWEGNLKSLWKFI